LILIGPNLRPTLRYKSSRARSERTLAIADYLTAIASLTLAMGSPATTASKEGSSSKYPPTAPSVPPSTKPQKTPAHF
jgi:hypothetical protein